MSLDALLTIISFIDSRTAQRLQVCRALRQTLQHQSRWLFLQTVETLIDLGYGELLVPLRLVDRQFARQIKQPPRFWYNKNPGLALPMACLPYHQVRINVEWATE